MAEPTNVHYHGLHIPPTRSADNSFLKIAAGERFTYEFDLPAWHAGGTFWYHPHVHESAARQVSRGLAGVFIVRGELDRIEEIAAAPEWILVLQDFDLRADGVPEEPSVMERMMGQEGDLLTVNAAVNPTIGIERNGWIRLRIVNASASRFYRLALEEHPLHVIGVDGGALPGPEERDEVVLVPGERVELMIRGTRPEGSYRLLNLPYDRGGMGMGATPGNLGEGPMVLATIVYAGQAERTWDLPRHLVGVEALREASILRRFVLGQGMGMGMGGGARFTINGRVFDANRVDTRARLNTVEDWEFVNGTTMDHPMHIHTNPFQVLDANGVPMPGWKDVVLVRAGTRVRIRTAFRDYTGAAMYHCHILDHEDLGMMGLLDIQG